MDGTQCFSKLIEQLAQQQRIISQLRQENHDLKDKNFSLQSQVNALTLQITPHTQQQQQRRLRKQIFGTQSSPIRLTNPPVSQNDEMSIEPAQQADPEMESFKLALELQRQEEMSFYSRLQAMQTQANPDDMDYEQLQELQEKIGFVSKGFKPNQIEAVISKYSTAEVVEQDCTICFSSETQVTLPCKHGFHQECLSQWFSQERTCPLCKTEITFE